MDLSESQGARRFSAVMTTFLEEHFGEEPDIDCRWKTVVRAFQRRTTGPNGYGMGYEWDADKNLLSTAGPVTPHAEITLIQYLLESGVLGKRKHTLGVRGRRATLRQRTPLS